MRNAARCVLATIGALLMWTSSSMAQSGKMADEWLAHPVDDRTFRTYLDFFVYDKSLPFDATVIDSTEERGMRIEHLSFMSTAGTRVFALYYQPVGTGWRPGRTVILLHGGSSKGKGAQYIRVIAERLLHEGIASMAIDLQYWGERKTDLLATFAEQEKHDRLYNQPSVYLPWVEQTVKDVGRTFDFLVEKKGSHPKKIFLMGISRGAILGTIAGGVDSRLRGVVLLYGGHFDALEKTHFAAACPANYIGRISPRPLLMINGEEDTDMIKETSVSPLRRLAKHPKKLIWVKGGHSGMLPDDQWPVLLQWIGEYIK